jgi:hypothetical protein
MKVKRKTKGPVPYLFATVAAAGISILSLPLGLVSWPIFFAIMKASIGQHLDEMMEGNPEGINEARQGASHRGQGSGVKVSATIGSNGILFDLPMTREYTITDEE